MFGFVIKTLFFVLTDIIISFIMRVSFFVKDLLAQEFTDSRDYIESPYFPSNFTESASLIYNISVPNAVTLTLTVNKTMLDCTKDILSITSRQENGKSNQLYNR